jgi:hypothetical protein
VRCAAAGFADFTPLVLHGGLEGCLYTDTVTCNNSPSGVYQEVGRELIVASLNCGPVRTFTTNFRFEATYDPDISISPKTARNHVSNVFTKLQVRDRNEAKERARRAGLGGNGTH